jgi:hypothetical protein
LVYMLGAILATLVTIPYLVFFLARYCTYKITKKRKSALRAGFDLTTLFLFFAVERMMAEIWGQSYYWILILLFLAGCLIFTIIIWKMDLELSIRKIMRMNWRLQFLLLSAGYFSLMAYGMIKRIMEV